MGTRQYYTLVYILFLVIVVGAFASMAQNEYGVKLLAGGCFGFSLLFLSRLLGIKQFSDSIFQKSWLIQELGVMSLIMLLFGLRALRIRFSFVEIVFVISVVAMIILYARYLSAIREKYQTNKILTISFYMVYGAVILFFLSMSMTFLNERISVILGGISFGLTIGFWILYFIKGRATIYKEERVLIIPEIFKFGTLSPIIFTMIIMMSIYVGLNRVNMIPDIYTGELPVRFMDLEQKAIKGELEPVDGVMKHEIYWEEYQQFLQYMRDREK